MISPLFATVCMFFSAVFPEQAGKLNTGSSAPSLLQYFTSRLKDHSANQTAEDSRNVLESKFNNVMTLCAMVPLLIFTCLNSFIHQR